MHGLEFEFGQEVDELEEFGFSMVLAGICVELAVVVSVS